MADSKGGGETSPAGKGGKLDSLNREDLVRYVKKQMLVLQKTKAKCDELNEKVKQLESQDGKPDVKALETELCELRDENKNLQQAYQDSQKAQEVAADRIKALETALAESNQDGEAAAVSNRKIKELQEQIECMQMKDQTLTTSMQCMQEDQIKLATQNQEMEEQVKLLTEARDSAMETLKAMKSKMADAGSANDQQVETLQQEVAALKNKAKEYQASLEGANSEHEKEKELLNTEIEKLKQGMDIESQKEADLKEDVELWKGRAEKMKQEKALLKKDFVVFQNSAGDFKKQLSDVQEMMAKMEKERDHLKEEKEHLVNDDVQLKDILRQIQTENQELKQKVATPCENCGKLEERLTTSENDSDMLAKKQEEIDKLEQQLLEVGEKFLALEKQQKDTADGSSDEGVKYFEQVADLEKRLHESEEQAVKCKEFMSKLDKVQSAKLLLEKECVNLQQKLSMSNQKLEEWEGMIQLMKDDREKLDAELLELENKERQAQEEMEELNRALQEALEERDAAKEQLLQNKETEEDQKVEEDRLKETVEDLKFSLEEIKEQNRVITEEKGSLQGQVP